ncbi:hypothetical protein CEXT_579231 [Caerostris extrusa]|uniref:Uncharacterized protein n=1 Tax=Caerostris extrusa TaxID=172846 RepID=A0AAV4SZZ1_CAEEX|nr:hypothetical protein CEXT_579231 [Caerostris extrusa]
MTGLLLDLLRMIHIGLSVGKPKGTSEAEGVKNLSQKQMLQIEAWNVRTMCQFGKTRQVTNEMYNYKLDILEQQKTVDKVEKHDLLLVMGDLNSKVGQKTCDNERSTGQ